MTLGYGTLTVCTPCLDYPGTNILEKEDATHHLTHTQRSMGGSPTDVGEVPVT